jgi:hypothetical protein
MIVHDASGQWTGTEIDKQAVATDIGGDRQLVVEPRFAERARWLSFVLSNVSVETFRKTRRYHPSDLYPCLSLRQRILRAARVEGIWQQVTRVGGSAA